MSFGPYGSAAALPLRAEADYINVDIFRMRAWLSYYSFRGNVDKEFNYWCNAAKSVEEKYGDCEFGQTSGPYPKVRNSEAKA